MAWERLPFDRKLLANIPESSLQLSNAAIENCFINESGGHSRFPGLKRFCTIPDGGRIYLEDWRGDLVAGTSRGNVYRVTPDASAVNRMSGVAVAGGERIVFAKTENELVMAAGAQIIRMASDKLEVLSDTAPLATHVAYLDSYLVANEIRSGRFRNSGPGDWRTWEELDTNTAESNPDDISALAVTPFRELLLAGRKSIEQFERITEGASPFFRRWANGTGLGSPYTLVPTRAGAYCLNDKRQIVRFGGQSSTPQGDAIQSLVERIDDFDDAWGDYLYTAGSEFYLCQFPKASNTYGTKGVTIIFDTRSKHFCFLYGWDPVAKQPARWPGWSTHELNGVTYVGGEGVIYTLTKDVYDNDGQTQRVLFRTGHYSQFGECRIDDMRMRCRRGEPPVPGEPTAESRAVILDTRKQRIGAVRIRVRKDGKHWSKWVQHDLGEIGQSDFIVTFGAFGYCYSFQVEIMVTDPVPWEFVALWADITKLS